MKGIVFTEFVELVEGQFGIDIADRVIAKGCPMHHCFTAVGTYDYRTLIAMVNELQRETGLEVALLIRSFGHHLFGAFRQQYEEFFDHTTSTIDLLQKVEHVIHQEVRKLLVEAELPRFSFPVLEDGHAVVEYVSARPFAELAHGLIEASIEHFGEDISVTRTYLEGTPGTHALFELVTARE